jgi:hypothetical protein
MWKGKEILMTKLLDLFRGLNKAAIDRRDELL